MPVFLKTDKEKRKGVFVRTAPREGDPDFIGPTRTRQPVPREGDPFFVGPVRPPSPFQIESKTNQFDFINRQLVSTKTTTPEVIVEDRPEAVFEFPLTERGELVVEDIAAQERARRAQRKIDEPIKRVFELAMAGFINTVVPEPLQREIASPGSLADSVLSGQVEPEGLAEQIASFSGEGLGSLTAFITGIKAVTFGLARSTRFVSFSNRFPKLAQIAISSLGFVGGDTVIGAIQGQDLQEIARGAPSAAVQGALFGIVPSVPAKVGLPLVGFGTFASEIATGHTVVDSAFAGAFNTLFAGGIKFLGNPIGKDIREITRTNARKILGLPERFTKQQLKENYRTRIQTVKDAFGLNPNPKSVQKATELNLAKEILEASSRQRKSLLQEYKEFYNEFVAPTDPNKQAIIAIGLQVRAVGDIPPELEPLAIEARKSIQKGGTAEKVVTKIDEILQAFDKKLKTTDINIVGSLVKGTAKSISDIDILLTVSKTTKGLDFGRGETMVDALKLLTKMEGKLQPLFDRKVHITLGTPAKEAPSIKLTDFFNQVKGEVPTAGLKDVGLQKEPAPFIRKRETTLLKERIKAIQRSAATKADKTTAIQKLKSTFEAKLEKSVRKEQLKTLRAGITQRIKGIAKGIREGSFATKQDILKAGNELKATLKEAGVSSDDAKWFDDTFKNLTGTKDLANKLPEIIQRAERVINAREIRGLKSKIIKELKKVKPKRGLTKMFESKFGAEAQKQLTFIKNNFKGNRATALAQIEENINKFGVEKDGVMPEIPEEIVKNNALLNMVGIKDMNVSELNQMLANIQTLKESGRLKILLDQANKASEIEGIKEIAKTEFKSPKMKPAVLGEEGRKLNPVVRVFNVMENALLGQRNIMEKMTFSKEFQVADWVGEKIRVARNEFNRFNIELGNAKKAKFKEIFGEEKLSKIYRELNKEQSIFKGKDSTGKEIEIKLSQFEAAYWWAQSQDPTMLETFVKGMNFTPQMFNALNNFVKPEIKKYTEYLVNEWLKDIRTATNPRYVVRAGMDMPNNPNYMPILWNDKPLQDISLLAGEAFPHHPSTIPSATKARTGKKGVLRKISIEQVMRRHINQMNQFIHFDEAISDLRKVFNDPDIKEIIIQSNDKSLYNTAIKKIDDIARGGMATQMALSGLDSTIGRFSKATLLFNFVPFLKQITSIPAFTLGRGSITYPQLIKGSFAFQLHPIKWTKMFAESDFIFGRLTQGFDRETALAFRQGNKGFVIKEVNMTLVEFIKKGLITPTRGGDMIPILPGMTSKYLEATERLTAAGKLTPEQIHKKAIAEAEVLASRTQQSPYIEDQGRIQTANSIGKAISMYATTPIQYLREMAGTVRQWNRGQDSFKNMLRALMTGWIVLPQLFQFVSNGFKWNEDRQLRALLLGPINYYPAIGNLVGTMYDAFAKGETWQNVATSISPLFSIPIEAQEGVGRLNRIVFKGEKDEWAKFAENLYITFSLATGITPSTLPRTLKGISDLVEDKTDDFRRLLFSEYSLDTGEEKKKDGAKIPSVKIPSVKIPAVKIPSIKF